MTRGPRRRIQESVPRNRINEARASESELDEFVRFLGPVAARYTRAELRQLRREMYELAELVLDFHYSTQPRGDQGEEPRSQPLTDLSRDLRFKESNIGRVSGQKKPNASA